MNSHNILSLDNKPIKKRKKGIIFLILIMLLSVLSLLVLSIDFFNIKEVEFGKLKELNEQEILRWSGIVLDKNIFKLNKKDIRYNLLKHPYIKDVSISLKLPSTIKVDILEREIVGAIVYLGSYIYIDEEGYILKIDQSFDLAEAPLFIGIEIDPPKIGNQINTLQLSKFDILISIVQSLKTEEVFDIIKEIRVDDGNNVLLICDRGNEIYLGIERNYQYKIAFVKEILDYLKINQVRPGYINIKHNGNPVYSPTKEWED